MKQWEAQDVKMENEIRITKSKNEEGADILILVRNYRFIDAGGNNLPDIGAQRLVREMLWNDIPQSIKAAFGAIHQWTYMEALAEHKI